MSTHPNVILMAVLTVNHLARQTKRELLALAPAEGSDSDVLVGDERYHVLVMESDYEDDYQISAPEGSVVLYDLVTYGYGETITWAKLEQQKKRLEDFLQSANERLGFTFEIQVSANYW